MSIRKRLFISNAAMIILPIFIIMIIFILLHIVLSDNTNFNGYIGHDRRQSVEGSNIELFNALKRIASLEEVNLLDQTYISALPEQFNRNNTNILVRKGTALINGFHPSNEISIDDLPLSEMKVLIKQGHGSAIIIIQFGSMTFTFTMGLKDLFSY